METKFPHVGDRAGWLDVCGEMRYFLHEMSEEISQPKIVVYLKTYCGWSEGVRAVMRKYGLKYEEKDIIVNPAFRWEMEQRSGQSLSPCVEIDGHMLADVSGEEVEQWMIAEGVVCANDAVADVPLDRGCSDAQHAAMQRGDFGLPGHGRVTG